MRRYWLASCGSMVMLLRVVALNTFNLQLRLQRKRISSHSILRFYKPYKSKMDDANDENETSNLDNSGLPAFSQEVEFDDVTISLPYNGVMGYIPGAAFTQTYDQFDPTNGEWRRNDSALNSIEQRLRNLQNEMAISEEVYQQRLGKDPFKIQDWWTNYRMVDRMVDSGTWEETIVDITGMILVILFTYALVQITQRSADTFVNWIEVTNFQDEFTKALHTFQTTKPQDLLDSAKQYLQF